MITIPSKPGTEASIRKLRSKIGEIRDTSRNSAGFFWLITAIIAVLYVGPTNQPTALLVILIVTAALACIYTIATESWFVVKIVDA